MLSVNVKAPNETIHYLQLYTYVTEVSVLENWGVITTWASLLEGAWGTDREEAHRDIMVTAAPVSLNW